MTITIIIISDDGCRNVTYDQKNILKCQVGLPKKSLDQNLKICSVILKRACLKGWEGGHWTIKITITNMSVFAKPRLEIFLKWQVDVLSFWSWLAKKVERVDKSERQRSSLWKTDDPLSTETSREKIQKNELILDIFNTIQYYLDKKGWIFTFWNLKKYHEQKYLKSGGEKKRMVR